MALDDQIRQTLDRALVGARGHLEADFAAFANELARLAAEDRTRAVNEAVAAAVADVRQKAHAQLAHIRDAAQKHTDELRRSAESQIAELRRAVDETTRKAQADAEDLRRGARAQIEDAHRTAQSQVDDVQNTMNGRIAELQGRIADGERRLVDAGREAAREKEEVRKIAAAEFEELIVAQLAVAAAAHERKEVEAIEQLRAGTRKTEHAHTTRLSHGIRTLDDARSLGEVLELLTQAAGREAERVAVLVARGDQLVGWTMVGFGEQSPHVRSITVLPDNGGISTDALRTGVAVSRIDAESSDESAFPPFARGAGARDALALPVMVGGAVAAVLYADAVSTDTRGTDRWPAVLDVLARHASKVLEALTVQQAVGLSLPRPLARASHDAVAGLGHDRSVQ